MVPHVVRRLAVRDLPEDFPLVEIDRADLTVRRLHDRQAAHRQAATAPTSLGRRARRFGRDKRRHRRDWRRPHRTALRPRPDPGVALDVREIVVRFRARRHEPELARRLLRVHIQDVRFGIERAARPVRPAPAAPHVERRQRSFRFAHDRWSEHRP